MILALGEMDNYVPGDVHTDHSAILALDEMDDVSAHDNEDNKEGIGVLLIQRHNLSPRASTIGCKIDKFQRKISQPRYQKLSQSSF